MCVCPPVPQGESGVASQEREEQWQSLKALVEVMKARVDAETTALRSQQQQLEVDRRRVGQLQQQVVDKLADAQGAAAAAAAVQARHSHAR